MSRLRTIPYAVLSMSLLAAGGASAQSMWSIDQREASQQQRIDAGRRDGSLTRSEASRLQQGEQRIDRYEARARADGVVTSGERQRLDGMLDRESRQINRERTDGQRAGGNGNGNGNHYGWDGGNHNGWNQADAGRNGWSHDPRRDNGRNDGGQSHGSGNNGSWNHSGQPSAPGTTPPAHAGWNGNGQGAGQANGQHNWGHQPNPNGTPTAPPATTPASGRSNGQSNGWTRDATHTTNVAQATPYTHAAQSRAIPVSAPATPAVAPSRAPSNTGRTSRH